MSDYDYKVIDIKGNEVSLKEYAGKLLVIVNTASKCGFTPQYDGLEKLIFNCARWNSAGKILANGYTRGTRYNHQSITLIHDR